MSYKRKNIILITEKKTEQIRAIDMEYLTIETPCIFHF
jgi:hypothetical protein